MAALTTFFSIFADALTTEKVLQKCLSLLSKEFSEASGFKEVCEDLGFDLGDSEKYPTVFYRITDITAREVKFSNDATISLIVAMAMQDYRCSCPQLYAWTIFSAYLLDEKKPISFLNYEKIFKAKIPDLLDYFVDFFNWVEWDSFHLFSLADKKIVDSLIEYKPQQRMRRFAFQKAGSDEEIDPEAIHSYVDKSDSEVEVELDEIEQ